MKFTLQKLLLTGCFLMCCAWSSHAQNTININSESKITRVQKSSIPEAFKSADRVRSFSYNPALRSVTSQNVGDTLLLDLFDDKKYKAVVEVVNESYDGLKGITARLVDNVFAYCYMTSSKNGAFFLVKIPLLDEQYQMSTINKSAYLCQYKASDIQKQALDCGVDNLKKTVAIDAHTHNSELGITTAGTSSLRAAKEEEIRCGDLFINEPRTLDVLVVYTTAAKKYAAGTSGSIDHVINYAFQQANQVLANSQTGVTLNVVHKYEAVGYVEQNNESDLYDLQGRDDGVLDEVHVLRAEHKADLVVFLANISFTGGLATIGSEGSGAGSGFSLSRIQQATSYTMIHEIGHNLGCDHDKDQSLNPGGHGAFAYSQGWHGMSPRAGRVCTIMAYADHLGNFHHTTIPYFSTPDITHEDLVIGDAEYANNALTIKRIKHYVSRYSDPLIRISGVDDEGDGASARYTYGSVPENPITWETLVENGTLVEGDTVIFVSDEPLKNAGRYQLMPRVYRNGVDVSCEYSLHQLPVEVIVRKFNIPVLFSNQTVTYNRKKQYITEPVLSGIVEGDVIDLVYKYEKDSVITDHALDAGTYTVKLSGNGGQNYFYINSTATFTVNKAVPEIIIDDKIANYTGAEIGIDDPTIDGEEDADFIIQYEGINGTIYGPSLVKPTNPGTYQVKVMYDGNTNYTPVIESVTLTIVSGTTAIESDQSDVKERLLVTPTEVEPNSTLTIRANVDNKELNGATVSIYNLSGALTQEISVTNKVLTTTAPQTSGIYIVVLKSKGYSVEKRIVVK